MPEDPTRPDSPRYAFRETAQGLEWFAGRLTRVVNGEAEFHGYPTHHVPIRVLKRLRDDGRLVGRAVQPLARGAAVTLLGNAEELGLDTQPLAPSWERRYAPEQTAWAALRIWVRGINLCEHLAPGSYQVQPAVNVPLAPLVDWLVRSWVHLRYEEQPRLYAGSDAPHENLRMWGEAPPVAGVDEGPWLESRERWWSTRRAG